MADLQTILHDGRLAAVVAGGQAIIPDSVPDRDLPTIKAMCLYALESDADHGAHGVRPTLKAHSGTAALSGCARERVVMCTS